LQGIEIKILIGCKYNISKLFSDASLVVKTEAFHADFFTPEKLKEMFSFRVSCTETQDAR